jgi:transcription elongation factor GreA
MWNATQNQILVDTARKDFHAGRDTAIANAAARNSFRSRKTRFVVVCQPVMDAELAKLVEAGKLTTRAAEQLDKLKPGTFCLHKSWGFGRVAEWSLLLNQIIIDFAGKKAHPMQLQYAADNLIVIPPEHFLARKAMDLDAIRKLSKENPAAVVKAVLQSHDSKATPQQISDWMVPDMFSEAEWKRWWESAKKTLKKDGHFFIPPRKTEPVELRDAPVAQADELIAAFERARQPKEQTAAMEQIVKLHHEFSNPAAQLQPVIVALEQAAARNQKLHPALTFELVLGRDDLLERIPQLKPTNLSLTLPKLILDEETRLASILPRLPAAKERRVIQAIPAALGERWPRRAWDLMRGLHPRLIPQVARLFTENGRQAELRDLLDRSIREHSATSEILMWLAKERSDWPGLVGPDLMTAILGAIEREQHNETNRGGRLRDFLIEDRALISDMFKDAEIGVARDAMRRLLLTPAIDELTKRSLLARIVKLYPELEPMITGAQPEEKAVPLIVSWSSLDKRRAEYEDLVKKKIPENTKEIALARSYGDLSENFEYKAAKQMQAVLMRRKTELEQMLQNARGTSFENPDTSRVAIGTVVRLRDPDSGREESYTILGAWDGDPDRHIISYQTAIGQALLGHQEGDTVTVAADNGNPGQFEILSIEPAPVDAPPANQDLVEETVLAD